MDEGKGQNATPGAQRPRADRRRAISPNRRTRKSSARDAVRNSRCGGSRADAVGIYTAGGAQTTVSASADRQSRRIQETWLQSRKTHTLDSVSPGAPSPRTASTRATTGNADTGTGKCNRSGLKRALGVQNTNETTSHAVTVAQFKQ